MSPAAAASCWPLQHAAQTKPSQGGESGRRSGRGRRRRRSHAAAPAAALQWSPGRLLKTSLHLTGVSWRGDTEVRAAEGIDCWECRVLQSRGLMSPHATEDSIASINITAVVRNGSLYICFLYIFEGLQYLALY